MLDLFKGFSPAFGCLTSWIAAKTWIIRARVVVEVLGDSNGSLEENS